jgi:hypothetical protein
MALFEFDQRMADRAEQDRLREDLGGNRARSRNGSRGSDARHRTEEAKDQKDSHPAEDEGPEQVLRQDRGEDSADRQDGTACPARGAAALLAVSKAASLRIVDRVRTPAAEPLATRPCHIRTASHKTMRPASTSTIAGASIAATSTSLLSNPFPMRGQVQPGHRTHQIRGIVPQSTRCDCGSSAPSSATGS